MQNIGPALRDLTETSVFLQTSRFLTFVVNLGIKIVGKLKIEFTTLKICGTIIFFQTTYPMYFHLLRASSRLSIEF